MTIHLRTRVLSPLSGLGGVAAEATPASRRSVLRNDLIAEPGQVTLPIRAITAQRPNLSQRVAAFFGALSRAAFPAVVGALMVAAPAQAQEAREMTRIETRLEVTERFEPALFTEYGHFKDF